MIAGIFANQEEIDSRAYIEGATIGSYKYFDFNVDAIVNEMDKVPFQSIFISLEKSYERDVYIGK